MLVDGDLEGEHKTGRKSDIRAGWVAINPIPTFYGTSFRLAAASGAQCRNLHRKTN